MPMATVRPALSVSRQWRAHNDPGEFVTGPLSHERRAAMEAIAEVEKKYERGVHIAEFAYAHAFFRILNGSKRVTVKDIGWFSPGLTAQDLRGKKAGLAGGD